jgi:hypothetical protein
MHKMLDPLLEYIRNGSAMRSVTMDSFYVGAENKTAWEITVLDAVFGNREAIRELKYATRPSVFETECSPPC